MGSPCPANITVWDNVSLNYIDDTDVSTLRTAINRELTRRGKSTYFTTIPASGKVTAADFQALVAGINTILAGSITTSPVTGNLITRAYMSNLRTTVNNLEAACLCNCNYCTCNCNYCTCNCNYCTCNCNYCSGNCCNCGCNNCHDNHCVNCCGNC